MRQHSDTMASLIAKGSTCVVDGGKYADESGVVVGSTVSHVPHFDVLVCHKLVLSSRRVEIDQQFSEFTLKVLHIFNHGANVYI